MGQLGGMDREPKSKYASIIWGSLAYSVQPCKVRTK